MSFEFINPFSNRCPLCRSWVRWGAKHCSDCGSPRKGAYKKCTECNESVKASDHWCWNCQADLTKQLNNNDIFHDRWLRNAGDLALQMKITFPKSTTRYGVQIDEGTEGLLFVDGKFKERLHQGYHDIVGTVKRIKEALKMSSSGGKLIEALIVPKGKVTLLVNLKELQLSDGTTVEASTRVTVTVSDADKFYTELMLKHERFRSQEFENSELGKHLGDALRGILASHTVETLLNSVPKHEDWQAILQIKLNDFSGEYGLRVESVKLNNFNSPRLEQLRANAGAQEYKRAVAEGSITQNKLDHDVKIGEIRHDNIEKEERLEGKLHRDKMQHTHDINTTQDWQSVSMSNLEKMIALQAKKKRSLSSKYN